jgi:hypothetical protein
VNIQQKPGDNMKIWLPKQKTKKPNKDDIYKAIDIVLKDAKIWGKTRMPDIFRETLLDEKGKDAKNEPQTD